jgi:hypothetical protein
MVIIRASANYRLFPLTRNSFVRSLKSGIATTFSGVTSAPKPTVTRGRLVEIVSRRNRHVGMSQSLAAASRSNKFQIFNPPALSVVAFENVHVLVPPALECPGGRSVLASPGAFGCLGDALYPFATPGRPAGF